MNRLKFGFVLFLSFSVEDKKHNMFIDLTIWIVVPYTTVTKARIYHRTRLFTVKTDGARVLDRNLNTKHVET